MHLKWSCKPPTGPKPYPLIKKNISPGDLQPTGRLPVGKKKSSSGESAAYSCEKKWRGEDFNPDFFLQFAEKKSNLERGRVGVALENKKFKHLNLIIAQSSLLTFPFFKLQRLY